MTVYLSMLQYALVQRTQAAALPPTTPASTSPTSPLADLAGR
jgi:hypothetical protein